MKRMKLALLDPDTGEKRDYWLSTPTPYILQLMADTGVDFDANPVENVDAIIAGEVPTDKELAAMTPSDRAEAVKARTKLKADKKRVAAMTPDELASLRAEAAAAKRRSIGQTFAMLAGFLTLQEPEGADGMPLKVWSPKQAADAIPWGAYTAVDLTLAALMRDAQDEAQGEATQGEGLPG